MSAINKNDKFVIMNALTGERLESWPKKELAEDAVKFLNERELKYGRDGNTYMVTHNPLYKEAK